MKLHIVYPGDGTRILPIKEIVEARTRSNGKAVFPGYTEGIAQSGSGQIYAQKGLAVTAVEEYAGNADGILDMSGYAAKLTHFAKLLHLCFTALNTNDSENIDTAYQENTYYRLGAHLLAQYIGKAVAGQMPDDW